MIKMLETEVNQWCAIHKQPVYDIKAAYDAIESFTSIVSECDIILYGFGIVGRRTKDLFEELGIKKYKVVDQNAVKLMDELGSRASIYTPDDINWHEVFEDTVVVASLNRNYIEELEASLIKKGFKGNVVDGQGLYEVLRSAKCTIDVQEGILHGDVLCHDCMIMDNVCVPRRESFIRMYGNNKTNISGSKKMWMIGYVLGQFCTLRCKHCCEAIPYYSDEQRSFVPMETVIRDITYMAKACEFLTTIEFIGGEPFLHPALGQILEEAKKLNNVGKVHVFTNGTVVPKDELCEILSSDRMEVTISNYQVTLDDRLKEKVRNTTQKLKKYNVNVLIGQRQGWLDFASFNQEYDDVDTVKNHYKNCFIHTCNRLHDGVLYHCPHEYAGALLGHFDTHEDILHIYDYTTSELAIKLDEYKDREYFESCKYCKLPYDAKPVVSGIQMEK